MTSFTHRYILRCMKRRQLDPPPVDLRDYLNRTGTKQEQLARRLQISQAHLSQIIGGTRKPSADLLMAIEDETGVPARSILAAQSLTEAAEVQHGPRIVNTPMRRALCTPLLLLKDQPGPIRAYKLVTADSVGPFNRGITYRVGESYAVDNADTDPTVQCAAGINVATLGWCLANYVPGYRVLIVEFTAADIAAIPTGTDGKLRLHRCTVVAEKDIAALVSKLAESAVAS